MKFTVFTLIILFSFLNAISPTGDIVLTVHGIGEIKGTLRGGLFNSEIDYNNKDDETPFRWFKIAISSTNFTQTFHDIPFGSYAFKIHYDRNGNGKMDKNFLGIPEEPYGFSNDAPAMFSAPPFDKTMFKHRDKKTSLSINLK
jgi:uncharacterized protein (DUF2141 family)